MLPVEHGCTNPTLWKDLQSTTPFIDFYVEFHETMPDAIVREKQIKKWRRVWKLALIEEKNPQWRDLYDQVLS